MKKQVSLIVLALSACLFLLVSIRQVGARPSVHASPEILQAIVVGSPMPVKVEEGHLIPKPERTDVSVTDRSSALAGLSGRIAFMSDRDGDWEIFVMNADGSSPPTQLTHNTSDDYTPQWSSDGSSIAFASDRTGDLDIYVMNADGSGQVNLTNYPSANDALPDWSPDGSKIIFCSNPGGSYDIYVMSASGDNLQRLTYLSTDAMDPTWSPDGSKIAFMIYVGYDIWWGPIWDIYTMDADGGNLMRLTENALGNYYPDYSPDGQQITFSSTRAYDSDVFTMNSDGSQQHNLTYDSIYQEWYSVWSPDGTKLAYTFDDDLVGTTFEGDDIYMMNPDGTQRTNLTNDPASHNRAPSWGIGGGPSLPFMGTISPVYPTTHTTSSTVMQGGTAYRHFRLLDAGINPISNATVTLSTGETALSYAGGYFTATISADGLGGLGSYAVSVQSVTYGGQTYTTNEEPSFSVEVTERRYAHSWECGAVRKASGGVSSGLVAYLTGEVNGGMALTLDESDPDSTDDDHVTMEENYTGESGAGFGADFSPSIKGGLTKVEGPGSHLVGELLLRAEAGVSSTFDDPYQTAARETQGLMLLAGIADSLTGFPGQPLLAEILALAGVTLPYDEVTAAAGIHERADLGIDGLKLGFLIGKEGAELNAIDLKLMAATGDMTVVVGHKYYDTQISEFYVLDLSWQASRLATEIWPIRNLIGNYVGEYVATVREEVFYDQSTGEVTKIELSITGEGNDLTFTDIDQSRVTTRYIIPNDQIDQEVLDAAHNLSGLILGVCSSQTADLEVGDDPIIAEINGLLGNVNFVEYEITTEDGSQLNLVPEIGLEGILKIELGAGVELKKARHLIYQQGVILNGEPYFTVSYQADSYVARPGKNWTDLVANAVGGLWDLVKDFFSLVWQQVTSGVEWVIGIVAKVGGIVQGGAQVTALQGAQLSSSEPRAMTTIQSRGSITVTAIGWVPTGTVSNKDLDLSPALATASGGDFVVGGIYEFSPASLVINPAATLVITYTDEAASGVDESCIGAFRWNAEENSWQLLSTQADIAHNTFTTTITQLGTFALGYDGVPPQISILAPADGSTISNALPLITALVVDEGTGIDPATVEMRLDGQVVAADYIAGTGQLLYLPGEHLANDTYTVTVSAADVMGNHSSASATFTVEVMHRVYLPLILRNC